MSLPKIESREEWLVARKKLLDKEKRLTRQRDRLNAERRRLPMVEIDKEYVFEGTDGKATLLDLFDGCAQLIVQHFMFDPEWDDGCPSCSAGADENSEGLRAHLRARNTKFVAISRAPIEKIEKYKTKKGWTFDWYSSFGSDFNYDFHVTLDERVMPIEYNYKTKEELIAAGDGQELEQPMEGPGLSFFLRDGDRVFHTYSTFARGTEMTGGSYYFLDLSALGRQEEWEKPKGRAVFVRPAVPDFSE